MKSGPGYHAILFCIFLSALCPSMASAQSKTDEPVDTSTQEELESLFDLFGEEGYDDLSTVIPPADSKESKEPAAETTTKPATEPAKPTTSPIKPRTSSSTKPADIPLKKSAPVAPTKPVSLPADVEMDPVPDAPRSLPAIEPSPTFGAENLPALGEDALGNPFLDDPPGASIAPFALPPSTGNPPALPTTNPAETGSVVPRFDLDFLPSASDYEVLEPTPAAKPELPVHEPEASVVYPPSRGESLDDDMNLFEPSPSISDSVSENLDLFTGPDDSPAGELPQFDLDAASSIMSEEDDAADNFLAPDETMSGILEPDLGTQLEGTQLEGTQLEGTQLEPFADSVLADDSAMYESDTIQELPFCVPELELQSNPFATNTTGTGSRYPTTRLTGFFHADYSWFSQDSQFFGDDQDYRGFRRARLAAVGSVANNVDYMLEMDFGFPGRPQFMDVWMDVHGFRLGTLRVGQWRQPFGLGELNSVMDLVFHERASMFFLGPFRQTGVGLRNHNGRSTYSVSAFGATTDPFGNSVGDSNYGMAARLTTLLYDNPQTGNLFHIGAGYSHIQPGESGLSLFVPQELFGPTRFANIGPLFVFPNQTNLFNTEFAAVAGPWHAQAEVRHASSSGSGPDFYIPSAYAQIGYVLTGESRKYHRPTGSFRGGIDPFRPFGPNGRGAWEVALRFSHIDLNDSTLGAGRNNSLSIGLNWYLNRNAKFQFNYLNSKVARGLAGPGVLPILPSERDVDSFALRAQVSF